MPGGFDTPGERQRRADAVSEPPVAASGQLLDRRGEPVKRPLEYTAGGVYLEDRSLGPQRRYYRHGIGNGRTALVASAAHVPLNDRRAVESVRRRHQAWQTEAWDYFDEVGEVGYTTTYIANLMSKLRLYPAVEGSDGQPVAVDAETEGDGHDDARQALTEAGVTPQIADYAKATLSRLRSMQGGQSALLRELSLNLEVAGECYLHGHATDRDADDPGDTIDYRTNGGGGEPGLSTDPSMVEDWNIRSVDELIITGDRFELRLGPGTKMGDPIPDTDLVIRVWERHPRFSELATCAMRRVLAEAEALLLLSREIRATSKSRLSNGILLIPSELSFGSVDPTHDGGDGEETDDPFDAELQEAMITPIQEEGSASAVVPLVLRGPAELLQHVNHLALDKTLDPVLDTRIEQRILRIARGLNMPTEVTTGLMSTTFANAVQVKRSEFEDHIEPRAILVCDAITSGYFQWALEVGSDLGEGLDPDVARKIFVWFDASQLIRVDDQSEQAVAAHQDGVISAEARRRYTGFTEADAPDMDELLLRVLLRSSRLDPTSQGFLIKTIFEMNDMPISAPAAGVLGIPQSVSAAPVPGAPPEEQIKVAGIVVDPPPQPEPPPPPPVSAEPAPGAKPPEPAPGDKPARPAQTTAAPVQGAATAGNPPDGWGRLGATLTGVDRDVRTRTITRLDAAMRAALDRAGNRIKAKVQRDKTGGQSALRKVADTVPPAQVAERLTRPVVEAVGMSEGDLIGAAFDPVLVDVAALFDAAFVHACHAVEKVAGPIPVERRAQLETAHDQNVGRAIAYLRTNLHALASVRLYDTSPVRQGEPGEHDGTVLIPASMVRAAIAIAGGQAVKGAQTGGGVVAAAWAQLGGEGPVTTPDGKPLGGIGTGPDIMGAATAAGGSREAWRWEYGAAIRHTFQPHLDLDGKIVASTDDPSWSNSHSWPETTSYFPGDHGGCLCDIAPVLVGPDDTAVVQTPGTGETAASDLLSAAWGLVDSEGTVAYADGARMNEAMQAAVDAQNAALTPDQQAAWTRYTDYDYQTINGALRNPEGADESALQTVLMLDEALARSGAVMADGRVLYRGIDAEVSYGVGDVIADQAFNSTSLNRATAEWFSGRNGTVLQILAPQGTRYLVGARGAQEAILGRGSPMIVESVETVEEKGRRLTKVIVRLVESP